LNICVFASGAGSNFRAILSAVKSGLLRSKVKLLITNNPGCGAVAAAEEFNVEAFSINRKIYSGLSDRDYSQKFLEVLKSEQIDFIVLAGYMKPVPDEVIESYRNRITNIHPALLPSFGGKGMFGMNVHEAVIKSGVKVSGITIHFVNEIYDEGKIIFQKCIEVENDETPESLQKKIQKLEHEYYPEIIRLFEENKVEVQGQRVVIGG
jgi:phosphoribosylglycinamide formyltransferase-1